MARKKHSDDEQDPDQDPIHRENVPGELDHASGQVEGFEAGIVSGADGEQVDPATEADLARQAEAAAPAGAAASQTAAPAAGRKSGISRFPGFVRASWSELQRVQWPDRRQVGQATAVVLGFVVIAGAYLGLADAIAQRFVDIIL